MLQNEVFVNELREHPDLAEELGVGACPPPLPRLPRAVAGLTGPLSVGPRP